MPGLIERLAVAGRYAFTGQVPAGANWFGPHEPLPPMAPEAVAGRRTDYRSGVNLDNKPRQGEGIDFQQLRALADNCGIVRLVIETRKDQLGWRKFDVRPKEGSSAKADDPDIIMIKTALEYPDREHDWETWLKALVEEMLVIDAATIYPRRARNGSLYSLDLIDGATIKCIIDPWGRRPVFPDPAYQQVLHGLPAIDYTADELLYLPRNYRTNKIYGLPPVEQIVIMINIALRREWHKLQYYTEGTVPDALAGVPGDWNINQISEFQDYFDTLLENNTAQRRKIRFVPETIAKAFIQTKEAALKDDFDEFLARFVCYAFSVSSQWAVKMMNRSTAESAAQQATEEGLAPLQSWVKNVMTRVIAQVFKRPDLEFSWQEDTAVDPSEQSKIEDLNLRNASATINQVRAARGEDPVEYGNEPLIYTATGVVTLKDALNPPAPPSNPPLPNGAAPQNEGNPPPAKGKMQKAAGDDPDQRLKDLWTAHLKEQASRVTLYLSSDDVAEGRPADADTLAAGAIDASATATERHVLVEETAKILLDAGQTGIEEGVAALVAETGKDGATAGIVMGPQEAVEITNLAHPSAVEYATSRSAKLVSNIDETTRGLLRGLIAKAQEEGWSTARLADEVEAMGGFGPVRADMIARTELAGASIRGNLASWITARDRFGIKMKKRVILGINEQHCAACADAVREGPIDLDDSWNVGYAPPFHPRCGCDVVPEVDDSEEGPRATGPFDRMEKAFDPDQPRDTNGKWSAGGYDAAVEILRGQTAMHTVIGEQRDVPAAMRAPGLGPVSFVWGTPGDPAKDFKGGFGINHIIAKRNAEGHDGQAVALKIPEIIARGQQQNPRGPVGGRRVDIVHDGHIVVLSLNRHGKDEAWVLSGWKKD